MTCAASPTSASALGDERARDRKPERKRAPRPDRRDVAEMQAETPLELGVKLLVRQRDDALGLFALLGPDDRRAMPSRVALQRQDRERTGRQEMLLGAPVVIALVRDGRRRWPTDRSSSRGVAMPARSRIAECAPSAATSSRAAIVSPSDKRRRRRGRARRSKSVDRRLPQVDAFVLRLLRSARRRSGRILDHVGERLARLDVAVEGEEDRPHGVAEAAVGDDHVENRLRLDATAPTRRSSRTAAAPRRRWRRRAHRRRARASAGSATVTANEGAQRPGAAQSPAPGRQSRRRRSAHRSAARCLPMGHARPPGRDYSIVIARSRGR